MSETWFIADSHLGHQRIIEYTNRPFQSVNEMDETIINNWNSVVSKKDNVYILGDFSLTGKERTLGYLRSLKGKKHLIKLYKPQRISPEMCWGFLCLSLN